VASLKFPRPVYSCACGAHVFCRASKWGIIIADPHDVTILEGRAWSILESADRKRAYAVSREQKKTLYLHRAISSCADDLEPDHVNHNGLDNRRVNLEIGTRGDNLRNRRGVGPSGFRGVAWHKHNGLWQAYAFQNGSHKCAGYYVSAKDAAIARDQLCRQLGIRKFIPNFPDGGNP
jgi:hypothetical protein